MALVSPADPAQRCPRAAELWRSVRKRTRGSARGQANSLSKTRARVKRRRRAMECHGGQLMECHDDRKTRTRESNVALQDLEKTTLSTRAARGGVRQWCWETTRPRASEHDWMMLETRSQKLGRGQKTVYEQAKTPEVQNTVMDDRRADPQRVRRADPQRVKRAFPTAGKATES